jgi:tetratricopeptide (TPR) repeat protein
MDNDNIKLAIDHHRAGRAAEAEQMCRRLVHSNPADHSALNFLSAIASETGRHDEAIALSGRAIALAPAMASYHSNLGEYFRRAKRLPESIESHNRAMQLNPARPETYRNLGAALDDGGAYQEAIRAYSAAISLRPDAAESHYNLGNVLLHAGDIEGSIRAFGRSLQLNPRFAPAYYNLGIANLRADHPAQAVDAFKAALTLKPDYAEAFNNLGLALESLDRFDEAIAAFNQSLALQPNDAQFLTNLGSALFQSSRFDEAIAASETAIRISPDFPDPHWNLALQTLLVGQYEKAWPQYEWRWKLKTNPASPHIARPRWHGENLDGKTLLLHAEQGFGDTIQFFRFLPRVAESGGQIVLECPPELEHLLAASAPQVEVVAKGSPLPQFDVQCPLMSLAGLFNIQPNTIPLNLPYIKPPEPFPAMWTERPRIGLCWAGSPTQKNDRRRSIPLQRLAALAKFKSMNFFSLQKGDTANQKPPAGLHLIDWTQRLTDFADTAAMIQDLDLIITVDTALAHLAGAMSKPVWVLLPRVPPWHYGLAGDTSPWYPSMRLFRQSTAGDWDTPIQQISSSLNDFGLDPNGA